MKLLQNRSYFLFYPYPRPNLAFIERRRRAHEKQFQTQHLGPYYPDAADHTQPEFDDAKPARACRQTAYENANSFSRANQPTSWFHLVHWRIE
jgi:hypothetical protein